MDSAATASSSSLQGRGMDADGVVSATSSSVKSMTCTAAGLLTSVSSFSDSRDTTSTGEGADGSMMSPSILSPSSEGVVIGERRIRFLASSEE